MISEIYKPSRYFDRCLDMLKNTRKHKTSARRIRATELRAFTLSLLVQSFSSYRWPYWKFLVRGFFARPTMTAETVTMAVKGHHFFKMTRRVLEVDRFKRTLDDLARAFQERAANVSAPDVAAKVAELRANRDRVVARMQARYRHIHKDFRVYAEESFANFKAGLDELIAGLSAQASPA